MDNFLAGERREMVELYMGRGLREEDATLVIDTLLQYKHVFLDHMMVMELGNDKMHHEILEYRTPFLQNQSRHHTELALSTIEQRRHSALGLSRGAHTLLPA